MTQILLYGGLLGISVSLFVFSSRLRSPVGWLMLVVGVSVFAIRFQHDPYAFPLRGNLLSGASALVIGVVLIRSWLGTATSLPTRVVLALSPIVLFFALYATLAELEEVVVLRAADDRGATTDLRLWIVDYEGTPWVTMPRAKAEAHGLADTRVALLRHGVEGCVIAKRYEDRATVNKIFQLRHEKYRIQRLATAVGVFGSSAGKDVVTLRLEPCPSG